MLLLQYQLVIVTLTALLPMASTYVLRSACVYIV